MRSHRIPKLWFVLAALLVGAVTAPGQERTLTPMSGVNRGKPQPAQATLLLGVNETTSSIAEPGWPLIVSASKAPDDQFAAVPMPTNLKLRLTSLAGDDVALNFTAIPPATNAPSNSLFWLVAENETARLPVGRFRLGAVAGQPELANWRVEMGEVQIVASDPANPRLLAILKAHRAVLLGNGDEANAEIDRLIAANAEDKDAWIAKGDILMKRDLPDEALQAYDKALSLHKKTDREPIAVQIRRRSAFFRSLEKRGVVPPTTPR